MATTIQAFLARLQFITNSQKPIADIDDTVILDKMQLMFFGTEPTYTNGNISSQGIPVSAGWRLPFKIPSENKEKLILRSTFNAITTIDPLAFAFVGVINVTVHYGYETDCYRFYSTIPNRDLNPSPATVRTSVDSTGKLLEFIVRIGARATGVDVLQDMDMEHEGSTPITNSGVNVITSEVSGLRGVHDAGYYLFHDIPEISPLADKTYLELRGTPAASNNHIAIYWGFLESTGTPRSGSVQEQVRASISGTKNKDVKPFKLVSPFGMFGGGI